MFKKRYFFPLKLLLLLAVSFVFTWPCFAWTYIKKTKSPYKNDPPGTYIEERYDTTTGTKTRHYYKGGVEYKYEDKKGVEHAIAPPTDLEVHEDGSLWQKTYTGMDSNGNKTWKHEKIADMIPEKYLTRDEKGNIKSYNLNNYINPKNNNGYLDDKKYLDDQ